MVCTVGVGAQRGSLGLEMKPAYSGRLREGASVSPLALSLGVGTCIAATEVQRYAALWPVGMGSTDSYALLLVFLAGAFGGLALLEGRHASLRARVFLVLGIVLLSFFGVSLRIAANAGLVASQGAVRAVMSIGMEAPYLLMVLWARWLIELNRSCGYESALLMKVVASGIVFAGAVQMVVSLLAESVVSYAIALLLAPVSGILLWRLAVRKGRRCEDREADVEVAGEKACPASLSPLNGGLVSGPAAPAYLALTGSVIAVSSLVVYVIHVQWTGVQDSGSTSLLVQICTGLGMLLAGCVLYGAVGCLGERPESLADLCLALVVSVAGVGLYLSQVVDGPAIAVSVVPLNVMYAALLFFVWCIAFLCNTQVSAASLSLSAFLLKRVGVLAGPFVVSLAQTLGLGLTWLTFGVMTLLIVLYVALFLVGHGRREVGSSATSGGPSEAHDEAAELPGRQGELDLACRSLVARYGMTPREAEVLFLLARGRTARHIGRELGMSDATVKTHISHIYRKMHINSQQALLDVVEGKVHEEA